MTTKTSPARKRPFSAPSPAAFEAMTLRQRALCFGRFLRSKPKDETYVYFAPCNCALGQFARAIYGSREAKGITHEVRASAFAPMIQVIPYESDAVDALCPKGVDGWTPFPFGDASRLYDKALRSTPKSAFTT